MSAGTWSNESAIGAKSHVKGEVSPAYLVLRALGSLKITVTMFGLGILLLFFGTLAQDQQNLAEVKRLYFNAWLAVIPLDVLLPITIFPHTSPFPGNFPFPGGATIGLIMLVNLIAAKATRFSVHAKGTKLASGIVVSLIGAAIITVVIIGGHAADGLQGAPPISYDALWSVLRAGFALATIVLIAYAVQARKMPKLTRILSWVGVTILLSLTLVMIFGGSSARLNDPGMRIVWQLLQAGIASAVCLVGLVMVFGVRGGNVLIHAGIGLMMVGQFVFGDRQVEQRLSVAEGESTSLVFQQDAVELAIIDTSDPEKDAVTAIPEARLRRAVRYNETIGADELPFKLKIVEWMTNSSLVKLSSGVENPATMGDLGMQAKAEPSEPQGGAMQGSNIASAYVQIFPKSGGEAIGTVLLTQHFNDQAQLFVGAGGDRNEKVTVDGKEYELALRFRREYKPYKVTLKDVERVDYSGTETPRDYSSTIVITDKESGDSQEGRTWMNNPIRYRGETFYQSQYQKARTPEGGVTEITGLQVVENAGWVIPYVTCMMVLVGMLAHFGGTFHKFASRYDRGAIPTGRIKDAAGIMPAIVGIGIVAMSATYYAMPKRVARSDTDWTAIAQIPVQHEGRIKPLDTVAKNVLQVISEPVFNSIPYVKDAEEVKRSPTEWLMGVMADQEWTEKAPVFRIYSEEVQTVFGLEPSSDSRYAYSELVPNMERFRAKIAELRNKKSDELTQVEQKFASLNQKLSLYNLLTVAYRMPPLPDPSKAGESEEGRRAFSDQLMQILDMIQQIEAGSPPAIIPPDGTPDPTKPENDKWQAYGPAIFATYVQNLMSTERVDPNPALRSFTDVLDAVREGKSPEINKSVSKYIATISELPVAAEKMGKAKTESWFNKFAPTAQAVFLYLFAIVLAFATFMTGSSTLRRGTFWLLVATFVIHSIAIISRIYISGRPPVINLYSSAVFIGWATALLGLILELIYPIGVCNLAVALTGVITLSVAKSLDNNDTMHVLQAVLDTQFWLSTHVVTITYGYAATYLAGILGIIALVHRMSVGMKSSAGLGGEDKRFQDILYRMTYGVVCFGLFLSFIGTVLGGLWADDSWGRFWGWDPKENGALMIVLWNAIVIHSRWDKQVGQRGFAILAVVGNIITTWSWFGVNQLGVGLHSYGNNSSVLITLAIAVGAHIAFIIFSFIATQSDKQLGTE
jgi:ABC-type transport system involved in cytochrome c biogenesis permease subunit